MKFNYIIGNPPYQEDVENNGRSNPVYNYFMDMSYKISDKVCLITPARFLFNAGQTPRAWNEKMLSDKHFKVILHEQESYKIFPNTDIKGGVAVTYRDKTKDFGEIGVYTLFDELNSIKQKVAAANEPSLKNSVLSGVPYRFSDILRKEHPEWTEEIGDAYDLRSNIIDKMQDKLFFDEKLSDNYIQILGLSNGQRAYKWIKSNYINPPANFNKYKIFVPESNGSGAIGEVLTTPLIGEPLIGHTQTFISIGTFDTLSEAENCFKYIKSKFARTMLGVLKITQHNPRSVWKYVPIQDFTLGGDIDWSKPIHEIDAQLYKKYNLSAAEIAFIEEKVRAME